MQTQPQHDAAWHRAQAQRLASAAESATDAAATLALGLASVHAQIAALPRPAWRRAKQDSGLPRHLDWPGS